MILGSPVRLFEKSWLSCKNLTVASCALAKFRIHSGGTTSSRVAISIVVSAAILLLKSSSSLIWASILFGIPLSTSMFARGGIMAGLSSTSFLTMGYSKATLAPKNPPKDDPIKIGRRLEWRLL